MVKQVENKKLFHVTLTKPYKTAFVADQKVTVGEEHTPFFGFYENAREYPVNQNGEIIQVKAVNWLKRVRDKTLTPHPSLLEQIAVEVAVHYVMLCRELIME